MQRGRPFWMPLGVLALGLASIALLVATDRIREGLLAPVEGSVRTVGRIQTVLATAHLWVEEYVSGDEVELEEVVSNERAALELADALLGRGRSSTLEVEPFTEPELVRRATRVRDGIEAFRQLTDRRIAAYQAGAEVGVASPADAAFDSAFDDLLAELEALDAILQTRLVGAHQRSHLLFRTFLIAWAGLVLLAVLGLWSRVRRQHRAETALRASSDQLLQAQKLESIGQLAGGVAHDLNNYLAAISAQCEVLRMTPEPAERVRQKMDTVIRTTGRAAQLTQQLLAFGRRQPTRSQVVSLNGVVSDLTPMMERLLGDSVELVARLGASVGNVKIDPSQLEQVIVNLLINARDAMPGGGRVELATRHLSVGRRQPGSPAALRPGEWAVLEVRDSGTGIAPEVRDRLFEPFVTTKEHGAHSGLGLATVYGVLKQNGGEIEVESAPAGATFTLYLPVTAEAAPEAPREAVASRAAGEPRHVLLVEDNPDVRASLEEMLRRLGHTVTAAASGREALALFDLAPDEVDLLITDLVMPGLNGREVARALRERRVDLPYLYVSAHAGDMLPSGEEREALLIKPFTLEALAERIERVGGALRTLP